MPTAFILGAGLGTRLRPLTDRWPKPLVPVAHVPLITWAMRHLAGDLSVDRFTVNTHHLADAYATVFPDGEWRGLPVLFRHEPELLDTGGGLANILDLLPQGEAVAVYNGDILCDAPLAPLREAHLATGAAATLLLRSAGPLRNVTCVTDQRTADGCPYGPVLDLRGLTGAAGPRYQFSGICLVGPDFLAALPPAGGIFSMIPCFVEMIRRGGRITGVVVDDGQWQDLGTLEAFLAAHQALLFPPLPRHAPGSMPRIHPEARVAPGTLDGLSWAGPGVVVPAGCSVTRSVLLQDARLAPGTILDGKILF